MADGLKCFMIAFGDVHQKMAEWTVPLVEKHAGVKVDVLTEEGKSFELKPFEMKLQLLDRHDGHVLFVDVDAIVRSWDWELFNFDMFNAARDMLVLGWLEQELGSFFPLERCYNSGVWLANSQHKPVFDLSQKILQEEMLEHPYKLGDQSSLNAALWRTRTNVNELPQTMNYPITPKQQENGLPKIPKEVRVVHICGNSCIIPNPNRKLERVREAVEKLTGSKL